MTNPWLELPLAEYEAHMALPEVAQAVLLASVFGELLEAYAPRSVAILGCAGGNGFERVSPEVTTRIVGVDINPAYISVCGSRFAGRLPGLELYVGDLEKGDLAFAPADLVYAALVFEHVSAGAALQHIRPMLAPGGTLATVLQLPSPTIATVTPSPFARVQELAEVMHLVSPEVLQSLAGHQGLEQTGSRRVRSEAGKDFQVQTFGLRSA